MKEKITRRQAIGTMGAAAMMPAVLMREKPLPAIEPVPVVMPHDPSDRNDVLVAARNWYANRNPLFSRLPYVPTDKTATDMYSHYPGSHLVQGGFVTRAAVTTQNIQAFKYRVQGGGSAQTTRQANMPGSIQSPFDFNRTIQLQNMVDDIENSMYYGDGEEGRMFGLASLLKTNNKTIKQLAGPKAFVKSTVDPTRAMGAPDLMLVSTSLIGRFAKWGYPVRKVTASETIFGTPISIYETDLLPDISVVEGPLLRPHTAITMTSSEVYIRNRVNLKWNQLPNRGDMWEGEWLAEMAIEVVNEFHHSILRVA